MCFSRTDFPEPEPPMIESVSPSWTCEREPLEDLLGAEGLVDVPQLDAHRPPPADSQQRRRPERVQHQDDHAAHHDRARRRAADARGAAGGVEAEEAADARDHEAEAQRLDQRELHVVASKKRRSPFENSGVDMSSMSEDVPTPR